jgi:ribosomal protein L30/L7E
VFDSWVGNPGTKQKRIGSWIGSPRKKSKTLKALYLIKWWSSRPIFGTAIYRITKGGSLVRSKIYKI